MTNEDVTIVTRSIDSMRDDIVELRAAVERGMAHREDCMRRFIVAETALFGNGKPGLIHRMNRIDVMISAIVWMSGVVAALCVTTIGGVIVNMLTR